jgi:hypothetical protein
MVAPSTGEPSEVSLPDKLTRKVPAEPTFPLFGNAPNDKDVDVAFLYSGRKGGVGSKQICRAGLLVLS